MVRRCRRADELTAGDPWRQEVSIGPLIGIGRLKRVSDIVADSVAGGARIPAGETHRDQFRAVCPAF
ncbi:aldehyde dehydrogenase family protein [Nonomuraea solani]|uniref:aldehyde dehydrogenase family protein n=1 Tax=Nonomuraea solani TaxID=1144553 RepID=UPI0011B0C842|nr:aldehyde dehydrogenase family protein [Nonomuraea solani]